MRTQDLLTVAMWAFGFPAMLLAFVCSPGWPTFAAACAGFSFGVAFGLWEPAP